MFGRARALSPAERPGVGAATPAAAGPRSWCRRCRRLGPSTRLSEAWRPHRSLGDSDDLQLSRCSHAGVTVTTQGNDGEGLTNASAAVSWRDRRNAPRSRYRLLTDAPAQVSTGNQVAGEGGSPMRLRMLAWGAVLGLLVALFTPMAALAQADTTTTHFSGTETLLIPDPCTGAPGTLTGTFAGVIHIQPTLIDSDSNPSKSMTSRPSFMSNTIVSCSSSFGSMVPMIPRVHSSGGVHCPGVIHECSPAELKRGVLMLINKP